MADILVLAERFLRPPGDEASKRLSAAAGQALLQHTWPGNVRELQNLMEHCRVMVRHQVIDAGDLGLQAPPVAAGASTDEPLPDWLHAELPVAVERLERRLISAALSACAGNRTEAARQLGIHRQLLYRKLEHYGLLE